LVILDQKSPKIMAKSHDFWRDGWQPVLGRAGAAWSAAPKGAACGAFVARPWLLDGRTKARPLGRYASRAGSRVATQRVARPGASAGPLELG